MHIHIEILTANSNVVALVVCALQGLGVADGARANNEQDGLLVVGGQIVVQADRLG